MIILVSFWVNWSTFNEDMCENDFYIFVPSDLTLRPHICSQIHLSSAMFPLNYSRSFYGFLIADKGQTDWRTGMWSSRDGRRPILCVKLWWCWWQRQVRHGLSVYGAAQWSNIRCQVHSIETVAACRVSSRDRRHEPSQASQDPSAVGRLRVKERTYPCHGTVRHLCDLSESNVDSDLWWPWPLTQLGL